METNVNPAKTTVVMVLAAVLFMGGRGALGAPHESTLTIKADKVAGDLTNFVVYVDLAHMDHGFWNNLTTDSGATDIVVKNAGGEDLHREIVWVDNGNCKGEMHFKTDSLSGSLDTTFTISVGGGTGTLSDNRNTDTWSNGYLGVWHLQEAAGDHSDSTSAETDKEKDGHRHDNTYEANGKVGAAQCFDGHGDYIEIGSLGISSNSPLTVSAWVNLANLPSGGQHATVWGNYDTDDDRSLLNVAAGNATLTAFARAGGNTVINDVQSGEAMTANTWQYVAVSLNATAPTAEVCLDGAFTSGDYLSAIQADIHVIGAMKNSKNAGDYGHYFDGLIDEFRISDAARSAEWLGTEYNNQSSPGTFYTVTPEPGTFAALAAGALCVLLRRRRTA